MAEIAAYARPSRLYRYRALTDAKLDRELEAIVDKHVYCPLYKDMNDPMEGSHRESALLKNSSRYQAKIQEVRDALETFGIASFSETNMHEPMWAYYASNFEGICIEYSLQKLLHGLDDDLEMVRMTYNEKPPVLLADRSSSNTKAKLILSCKALRWLSDCT